MVLVSMILLGYREFFAPMFPKLGGIVLFSEYMFVNLQLSIYARFNVHSSNYVVKVLMPRL